MVIMPDFPPFGNWFGPLLALAIFLILFRLVLRRWIRAIEGENGFRRKILKFFYSF